MTTTVASRARPSGGPRSAVPSWVAEHRPFLVALALGVALRVLVQVAFVPAFVHSDGPMYLAALDDLDPSPFRPVGYVLLLLWPVSLLSPDVQLVAVVQHLLGLVTAVLLYALLRRWGVGRWAGTLATLPVLLDTLQLNLEHTVLSDSLFELVVLATVSTLGWHRRLSASRALAAGALLGAAVIVRVVAEPLVVLVVPACLALAGPGARRRTVAAAAAVLALLGPVGGYAAWYHAEHGVVALSQFTGKALYLRTTSFVDCSRLSVPDYQRVLCPAAPVDQRRDPTYYVFHDPRTIPRLHPPPGTSQDQALREFAMTAIRTQPLDYLRIAARDVVLNFDVERVDRFGYETAHKWTFTTYLSTHPTAWTGPAYAAHGGRQLQVRQPFADLLVAYEHVGYTPGPVLLGCLVLGLLGGLGMGRARRSGMRTLTLVMALAGAGLLLVPALTAEFVWRYQLPALSLLPGAAALGWTALRGRGPGEGPEGAVVPQGRREGTEATASTD